MSRRTTAVISDNDLHADATAAANGDEEALDRLFAQLGGAAWGVAFVAADAVGPASDAVAEGFAQTLQLFDNGLPVEDVHTELLLATRTAALESAQRLSEISTADGRHAREPVSLLGETKDRQATLALTALTERMRSALWLVEAEGVTIANASRILDKPYSQVEETVRQARANFRRYYVDAVKRDGLGLTCTTTLDRLAAYAGRLLPAGELAAVEKHLGECSHCRGIVAKLDDLEGRLRAGIPPVPAWTRQHVTDTWAAVAPAAVLQNEQKHSHAWWMARSRRPVFAGVAAALLLAVGVGVMFAPNSDNTAKLYRDASQVAAPQPNINNATINVAAVDTPVLQRVAPQPAPTTTSTTVAKSQPAQSSTASKSGGTKTPATTAAPRSSTRTVTIASPQPAPTGTQPSYKLVDFPAASSPPPTTTAPPAPPSNQLQTL